MAHVDKGQNLIFHNCTFCSYSYATAEALLGHVKLKHDVRVRNGGRHPKKSMPDVIPLQRYPKPYKGGTIIKVETAPPEHVNTPIEIEDSTLPSEGLTSTANTCIENEEETSPGISNQEDAIYIEVESPEATVSLGDLDLMSMSITDQDLKVYLEELLEGPGTQWQDPITPIRSEAAISGSNYSEPESKQDIPKGTKSDQVGLSHLEIGPTSGEEKSGVSSWTEESVVHACKICSFTSKHINSLNRHTKIHTGEKPFQCSFCPKAFARCGEHKQHERRHQGIRPFPCSICSALFVTIADRKSHERVHEKLGDVLKCAFCRKVFPSMEELRLHCGNDLCDRRRNGRLSIPKIVCGQCEEEFCSDANLVQHRNTAHGLPKVLFTKIRPYFCDRDNCLYAMLS